MKKEELLLHCIDEILAGRDTLDRCRARYPHLSAELAGLLETAKSLQAEAVPVCAEFKQRCLNALRVEMAKTPVSARADKGRRFGFPGRLAFRVMLGAGVFMLTAGSFSFASQASIPGDTLYPLKKGVEAVRLSVALSPESRADLHLERAQERIDEAVKMFSTGRTAAESPLERVPAELDSAILQISKVPAEKEQALLARLIEMSDTEEERLINLLPTSANDTAPLLEQSITVLYRGRVIARIAVKNAPFLAGSPSVTDEEIDRELFKIEGDLLSADNNTWNLGGLRLENISPVSETPHVGSRITITGINSGNVIYIESIVVDGPESGQTVVKGIFHENGEDDGIWHVGGVKVENIQGLQQPPHDTYIGIKGTVKDGSFFSGEVEEEDEHSRDDSFFPRRDKNGDDEDGNRYESRLSRDDIEEHLRRIYRDSEYSDNDTRGDAPLYSEAAGQDDSGERNGDDENEWAIIPEYGGMPASDNPGPDIIAEPASGDREDDDDDRESDGYYGRDDDDDDDRESDDYYGGDNDDDD
jgi:hypothetical protein